MALVRPEVDDNNSFTCLGQEITPIWLFQVGIISYHKGNPEPITALGHYPVWCVILQNLETSIYMRFFAILFIAVKWIGGKCNIF